MNEVNTHREQVLALEKAGSQLRFASLKQDVVLIKNLLLSVQARWDKLVQRSLDRGRHLDEARKRAKQVQDTREKYITHIYFRKKTFVDICSDVSFCFCHFVWKRLLLILIFVLLLLHSSMKPGGN